MKRHLVAKYRKARKLEHSKLKAKKELNRRDKRERHLELDKRLLNSPTAPKPAVDTSPARRAFQDT